MELATVSKKKNAPQMRDVQLKKEGKQIILSAESIPQGGATMQTLIEPLKQCYFCEQVKDGYKCRILDTVRCKDKKTKKVCTFYETKPEYEARQKAFERRNAE